MLVYKRRLSQGIVFDGSFRVTLEALGPEVCLSLDDISVEMNPVISVTPLRAEGTIRLGIGSPKTISEHGSRVTVTTESETLFERTLSMQVLTKSVVEVDGIEITVDLLEGGEHHGKPILHIRPPALGCEIDLAVLSQYNYGAEIATNAPQAVRIYRSEVWVPTADANEAAAEWTEAALGALGRPAITC